jgi:hypothetical protein
MKILFFSFLLCFVACQNSDTKSKHLAKTDTVSVNSTATSPSNKIINQDSILLLEAQKIVAMIQKKDYVALANTFHPEGVRFSIYGYVDTTSDLTLKKDDFVKNLNKKRKWGTSYGDEEPILKNTPDFFKRHVYDADFQSVTKPFCNKKIASGSTIMNTDAYYKGCDFVEFHKEGTKPKLEGMDWKTLHIVLKKVDATYLLVGIVHNEWTP